MKAFDPATYWRYGEVTIPYEAWIAEHDDPHPQPVVLDLIQLGQARGWLGAVDETLESRRAAAALVLVLHAPVDPKTGTSAGWLMSVDDGHPWYLTGGQFRLFGSP